MEIADGYFRDGTLAGVDLVRGEPIPDGIYRLSCEVLVRHIDGDYLLMQRDLSKGAYGGYYEATAGGAAQKGDDALTCIKRELLEETGIVCDVFEEVAYHILDDRHDLIHSYLCVTDCDKRSVVLQEGETMSYQWVSEAAFIRFVRSDEMIPPQRERYAAFFETMGY